MVMHETEFVEFKESLGQLNRAMESLAAMLNKNGRGKVCFGIRDNGTICGVGMGSRTITEISHAVAEQIKPAVIPVILCEDHEGKVVITVEVSGNSKPYSVRGEYRIRSGDENRKLEPDQLRDIVFRSSIEVISNIEAVEQQLRLTQLKGLYVSAGLSIDEKTFDCNMGLLTKDGKYNYLAELLSDSNNCSIKVVRFAGKDKLNMISRNEYGYKCMLLAMQQAYTYVESLNEVRVMLDGGATRKEVPLFDAVCLREAWYNACMHNRWAKASPPAIYIFSDRMEIVSTGGLPADYSQEEFFAGVSRPVNVQLQKIMGQLGMVEQTGHGVPTIVAKYGREAFELGDNHITVTIPFAFPVISNKVEGNGLSLSEQKVFEFIAQHPLAKIKEIALVLGLGESRITQIIKSLKLLGKLERAGSKKSGYWKVG